MRAWAVRMTLVLALAMVHASLATRALAQPAPQPPFTLAAQSEQPSLKPPLALFVPGAIALSLGTVLYGVWSTDAWNDTQQRAVKGLYGASGALIAGSIVWWGVQIARRGRWQDDRTVAECALDRPGCRVDTAREPSRFAFLYMAVPGALLIAAGAAVYAIGMDQQRESDRNPDPSLIGPVGIWPGGVFLMTLGGSVMLGSLFILNQSMRNHRRWELARAALARVHMAPVLRMSGADKWSPGLGLSAAF